MKKLIKIWNWILNLDIKHKLLLLIIILCLILFKSCEKINKLKNENLINKNNISVLNDSVKIYFDKNNKISFEKGILISDKSNLQKINNELFIALKSEKGKVKYLSTIITNIKIDTIKIWDTVIIYKDRKFGIRWKLDTIYDKNNYRSLYGESKFSYENGFIYNDGTSIYNDDINISLTTGIVERDKKLQIFVKSDYPGLVISNIDGAIIEGDNSIINKYTNKKKFSLSLGTYYGLNLLTFKPALIIGTGISYNLVKF
jgi:hypothetical protein